MLLALPQGSVETSLEARSFLNAIVITCRVIKDFMQTFQLCFEVSTYLKLHFDRRRKVECYFHNQLPLSLNRIRLLISKTNLL